MNKKVKMESLLKPLLSEGAKHENSYKMSCMVCGVKGSQALETLSDSSLNFLVKTGTIHTLLDAVKVICVPCKASTTLMEQACQVQTILATKFQKSRLGGRNGDTTHVLTVQLLRPGDGVNYSACTVDSGVDNGKKESTDDDGLIISDVKGGIETLTVSGLNGRLIENEDDSHYFKTVSTDTSDLASVENVQLECEVFDVTGPENTSNYVPLIKREAEEKSAALFPDVSYDVLRWLPTTSTSERSFGSNVTETTHSSGSKETLLLRSRAGWKCPMCDLVFDSSPVLVEHVHSSHSDMKTGENMTCPFCKKQFPTYTQLDDHITQLHGDGSHSCQGCYSVFLRSSLLRRHQQYCAGYEKYKEEHRLALLTKSDGNNHDNTLGIASTCSLCLIRFPNTDLLNQHITDCHTDSLDKTYNCEGCKAGFNLLTGLYAHQVECMVFSGLKKTNPNSQYSVQFSCHGCKLSIGNFSEYQDHKLICSSVKDMLESEAKGIDNLSCTLESDATEGLTDSTPCTASSPSNCETAPPDNLPTSTSNVPTLTDSHSDAHKSNSPTIVDPAPSSSKFAAHTCPDCLVHYEDWATLDKHTDTVHNKACDYKYRCAACQGGFMREESLKLHKTRCKRIKTALELYSCLECLMSFKLKSLRDFHMSIHRDCEKKPYRCDGCSAGFAVQTDKLEHQVSCGKINHSNRANRAKTIGEGNAFQAITNGNHKNLRNSLLRIKSEPMDIFEQPNGITDRLLQPFSCKICFSQFSYFCDFEVHSSSCRKDRTVKEEPNDSFLSDSDTYGPRSVLPSESDVSDRPSSSLSSKDIDFSSGEAVCPICDITIKPPKAAQLKCSFKRHMVGHSNSTSYTFKAPRCPACNWVSGTRRTFVNHTNQCGKFPQMLPDKEIDETRLRCPVCFITFSDMSKCESHYCSHHLVSSSSDGRQCLGCRGYFDKNLLQSHQQDCLLYTRALTVAGEGDPCGICCIAIMKLSSHFLELHAFKIGDKAKCVVCTLEFMTARDLIVHANTDCRLSMLMLAEELGEPVRAPPPNVMLLPDNQDAEDDASEKSEKSSVTWDMTRRGKRVCHVCGCRTVTPKHMLIHTESAIRPYNCEGCNAGLLTSTSLLSHENVCIMLKNKKIFGIAVNNNVPTQEEDEPAFTSTDTPTNVEMSLNVKTGKICLTCPICDEVQATEAELTEHILEHQNLHRCGACEKSFLHKESLNEHELHCGKLAKSDAPTLPGVDENAEEWKCLSCCVKFTDETSFLLHIASHEVSNVNKCFLCYTVFKSAADICMHMVKYHKHYLTTGLKEGTVDNEDEDSDDSDIEVDSSKLSFEKSRTPMALPRLTGDKSPKSKVNKEQLEESFNSGDNGCGKMNFSDFKYESLTGTKCHVCKRTFQTTAILKRHYGIHDGYYSSICLVCGIGFLKISQLKVHKAKVHKTPKNTDLVCTKCSGAFEHNFRLVKHMELCICPKNEEVMQCQLCVRTFETWNKLKSHVWTHLTKCSYCEDKIPVQSRRVEHMLTCAKNPLLNKEAKSRVLRGRGPTADTTPSATENRPLSGAETGTAPRRRPEGPKKYKCPDCCAAFTTISYMKKHQQVHQEAEYRCRVCGGKFASLLAKNRHILREHKSTNKIIRAAAKPEISKSSPVKTEPVSELELHTYFACQTCHQCFRSKEDKNAHEASVHSTAAKAFNCKLCDKTYPSKFARRRHMQNVHSGPASQSQNLSCHICSKRFPSNFAKLQHLKKYHKLTDAELIPPPVKKQRICPVCNATFEHKSELRAHKRATHPELKTNPDNRLDMTTPSNPALLGNGGDLVPEAKVRVCKVCRMSFAHKSELKAHFKSVHGSIIVTVDTIQANTFSGNLDFSTPMAPTASAAAPSNGIYGLNNVQSVEKRKVRVCKDCGKSFESKNELKAHRRAEHKQTFPTMVTVSGATLQMLEGKGPPAAAPPSANNNPQTSTNGNGVLVDLTSDPDDGGPPQKRLKTDILDTPSTPAVEENLPFRCPYCPRAFKLRMSLNRHQTKSHPWCP